MTFWIVLERIRPIGNCFLIGLIFIKKSTQKKSQKMAQKNQQSKNGKLAVRVSYDYIIKKPEFSDFFGRDEWTCHNSGLHSTSFHKGEKK